MNKYEEAAQIRNKKNQAINNVVTMIQEDLASRSDTTDQYGFNASCALSSLERYSVQLNKALDEKYGPKLKKVFVPRVYVVCGYHDGAPCDGYVEAVRSLKALTWEHSAEFQYGRIIKRYIESDGGEEEEEHNPQPEHTDDE